MRTQYLLALDAGTTSNRAIIYDAQGTQIAMAQKEFTQYYPHSGLVEHDPLEIWQTQLLVAKQAIAEAQIAVRDIASIGLTNQRETTVIWNAETGRPIYNAIVWQDRRTAPICETLKSQGLESYIHTETGLVLDAYFSGTKIKWILDYIEKTDPQIREKAKRREILFGTIDTWLIWNLTEGQIHVTDYSNASRTLLFNIKKLQWDDTLLQAMNIPREMLPTVKESSEVYGSTAAALFDGATIPISGIAGDQHAALFGQACFESGMAKATYGTGAFILMHTGTSPKPSQNGLLSTIAWSIEGKVEYALEGSVFIAGAAIQWLRDELGIISDAKESEAMAMAVPDTQGAYFVPAFAGLGAPYWDMYARGALLGLSRGTNAKHIVRATLESLAYQTQDVLECMQKDSQTALSELKVDGGACANDFILQFQANISNVPVLRPKNIETTAIGAAYLAGLSIGLWKDKAEILHNFQLDRRFEVSMADAERAKHKKNWNKAVSRAQHWLDE